MSKNREQAAGNNGRPGKPRILLEGGTGEYTEKKSRFIATLRPVATPKEAQAFFEEMKKRYWDARHHCSAYLLGERGELSRCSDDGEPPGTAGRPILEALSGEGLTQAAAVVARYFGGILLGKGGLARAYARAVREGLKACRTAALHYGTRVFCTADYTGIGKIQYILDRDGIRIEEVDYGEKVTLQFFLKEEEKAALLRELTEATFGRCILEELESLYEPIPEGREGGCHGTAKTAGRTQRTHGNEAVHGPQAEADGAE